MNIFLQKLSILFMNQSVFAVDLRFEKDGIYGARANNHTFIHGRRCKS